MEDQSEHDPIVNSPVTEGSVYQSVEEGGNNNDTGGHVVIVMNVNKCCVTTTFHCRTLPVPDNWQWNEETREVLAGQTVGWGGQQVRAKTNINLTRTSIY